jgi:rod shape-determining protein MreC
MNHQPPPFFKQGPSARVRLAFFALLAVVLLVVDARMKTLELIRQGLGVVLYPLQRAAVAPRDAVLGVAQYFESLSEAQAERQRLAAKQVEMAQAALQAGQLAAENAQLRRLLAARERVTHPSVLGEVLYEARDPFTRKVILDKGTQHGVSLGRPVIDDAGVVGQVTRVFPLSTEVSLLTDKDQAIPVQIARSNLRSIAFGGAEPGMLELRFVPVNADIVQGDVLITSGIDGLYPPGLPVAKVLRIERNAHYAFARVICQPLSGLDRHRQFLILLAPPQSQQPPAAPPPVEEPAAIRKKKGSAR